MCRVFLHRVVRVEDLNEELEKDISQWVMGSLLLLIATKNMESHFFGWVPLDLREDKVWLIGLRLLLAIGVIEKMPDQALFAIIHPGPPPLKLERDRMLRSVLDYVPVYLKGILCQHFNRSSPVLAILTVFLGGVVGWVCYALAITNYLIIGLVSSRDKCWMCCSDLTRSSRNSAIGWLTSFRHHPRQSRQHSASPPPSRAAPFRAD